MDEFVSFQSFYTIDEATEIAEILRQNNIDYKFSNPKSLLDPAFTGDDLEQRIFLNIRSADFPKANEILNAHILKNISSLETDYYLFSFSNEELQEIVEKPDEWSRQDFLVARKVLNERGFSLSDEKIDNIKKTRTEELSMPEKGSIAWIILGYSLALLGGLMSLIIGLPFLVSKKTLPDGQRIYTYDMGTRNHGKAISIICVWMLIFHLVFNNHGLRFAFIGFFGYIFW